MIIGNQRIYLTKRDDRVNNSIFEKQHYDEMVKKIEMLDGKPLSY